MNLRYSRPRSLNQPAVALLLLLGSCGKHDAVELRPSLSPNVSEKQELANEAEANVPAEAEVNASSGPIELSLLLYKTKIKLGDTLWEQLRVRNVGKQEILVTDNLFHDPWQLKRNIHAGYGIFIEIVGPDGKRLPVAAHSDSDGGIQNSVSGLLETEGPEEAAMLSRWRKQGLTEQQINENLVSFNLEKRAKENAGNVTPVIKLAPGESVQTHAWFHYGEWARVIGKRPKPRPIGDFAQLEFFDLEVPGVYKVRAIYNNQVTPDIIRILGKLPAQPEDVLARTPWIRVTVSL